MNCATSLVKYLFFAVNLIFWILGIVVLAIGIYSRVETDGWKSLIQADAFFTAANLLIAAGVLVMIIGFLGCCGAIKQYTWMLIIYAVLVILIFILEIAAGAFAYKNRKKVQDQLTKTLKEQVNINYGEESAVAKGITKAINTFQKKVKCCGASNASDWENSEWYKKLVAKNVTNQMVPTSCCKSPKDGCNVDQNYSSMKIYTGGCVEEGKKFAKDNLWLLGGVGVGIAVVELLSILFAIILICAFKKDKKEGGTSA